MVDPTNGTAAGPENTGNSTDSPTTQGQDNRIPYDRFKSVVDERNAARQSLEALQQRVEELENQKLAEQEDYKTLAEKAKEQAAQAAQESERSRLALLRYQIGNELGVPSALVPRLSGKSADEIRNDAQTLMESLPRPQAPPTDAGQPGSSDPGIQLSNQEQLFLGTFNQFLDKDDQLTPDEYKSLADGWNPAAPSGMGKDSDEQ